MKLQKLLVLSFAVGSIKNLNASTTTENLNAMNRSLYSAASSLAQALKVTYTGIEPIGYQASSGFSDQGPGTVQTTVTNYSSNTLYLIAKNIKNQQIHSMIKIAGQSFTYLPPDAVTIEVVDLNKKTLVGPTIVNQNTPYSITNLDKAWTVKKLDTTATFSYKNTTNIPLIVTITMNNMEIKEQINPSNSFSQTINPSTAQARKNFIEHGDLRLKYSPLVSIQVHANISSLGMMFEPSRSYQINIDATTRTLKLSQVATSGNVIMNKTGWPMLINVTSNNDTVNNITLEDGNSYKPDISAEHILIIPMIKNQKSEIMPAKSFNFVNNKGILTF